MQTVKAYFQLWCPVNFAGHYSEDMRVHLTIWPYQSVVDEINKRIRQKFAEEIYSNWFEGNNWFCSHLLQKFINEQIGEPQYTAKHPFVLTNLTTTQADNLLALVWQLKGDDLGSNCLCYAVVEDAKEGIFTINTK